MNFENLKKLFQSFDSGADDESKEHFVKAYEMEDDAELDFHGSLGAGSFRLASVEDVNSINLDIAYNGQEPSCSFDNSKSPNVLKVSQSSQKGTSWKGVKQKWNITLPEKYPTSLKVDLGAGNYDMNLSGMKLNKVDLNAGVGDCRLDLSNAVIEKIIPVDIDGGVGSMRVHISKHTPAKIKLSKGIGSFSAQGLILSGTKDYYTEAYKEGEPYLNLRINIGVGKVEILSEND
ncbi:LiaF domain-containing protein [Thalassobacillus hwangdonensis]|uniref:LiaF domain-containing protein n=1 Tax=Thalassobacillus hwangdonensis TaxID=546108 RepID=A0ABW3L4D5_9BACI